MTDSSQVYIIQMKLNFQNFSNSRYYFKFSERIDRHFRNRHFDRHFQFSKCSRNGDHINLSCVFAFEHSHSLCGQQADCLPYSVILLIHFSVGEYQEHNAHPGAAACWDTSGLRISFGVTAQAFP